MSCTQEITRNNPSVQGLKDGVLWRAIDSHAVLTTSGSLTITGITQYETLSLTIDGTNAQTYILGNSTSRKAAYQYSRDGTVINYKKNVGIGDDKNNITEYDDINQTISGKFRFNAENVDNNPAGAEILNYQQGVFYKIPVTPAL